MKEMSFQPLAEHVSCAGQEVGVIHPSHLLGGLVFVVKNLCSGQCFQRRNASWSLNLLQVPFQTESQFL